MASTFPNLMIHEMIVTQNQKANHGMSAKARVETAESMPKNPTKIEIIKKATSDFY